VGQPVVKPVKHILFVRHYESKSVKCQYAIDVIHESYLATYLDLVDQEMSEFGQRIKQHKKEIFKSIKTLSQLNQIKDKKDCETNG